MSARLNSRRARHHLLLAVARKGERQTPKNTLRERQPMLQDHGKQPAHKRAKTKTLQQQMGELKFRAGLMLPTFSFRRPSISGPSKKERANHHSTQSVCAQMPSQPRRKPAKKTYKLLRSKVRKSKPNFENGSSKVQIATGNKTVQSSSSPTHIPSSNWHTTYLDSNTGNDLHRNSNENAIEFRIHEDLDKYPSGVGNAQIPMTVQTSDCRKLESQSVIDRHGQIKATATAFNHNSSGITKFGDRSETIIRSTTTAVMKRSTRNPMSVNVSTSSRCIHTSNKLADKASLARLLKANAHGTKQLIEKLTRQEKNLKKEIVKLVDRTPEINTVLDLDYSDSHQREDSDMVDLAAPKTSPNENNATTQLRNKRKRERLKGIKAKNTASVHRIIAKAAMAGGIALKSSRSREEELERRHNRKLLSTNFVRQNLSSRGGRVGKKRKRRVSKKKALVAYTSHSSIKIRADAAQTVKRGRSSTSRGQRQTKMRKNLAHATGVDSVQACMSVLAQSKSGSANAIPLCAGHQAPCRLATVKKSGRNKGRKFYACSATPWQQRCDSFFWADEDPIAAAMKFQPAPTPELASAINRKVQTQATEPFHLQCTVWRSMTVASIKRVLRQTQLALSGNKELLVQRLATHRNKMLQWLQDLKASTRRQHQEAASEFAESAYERTRATRIAENNAMLMALGLMPDPSKQASTVPDKPCDTVPEGTWRQNIDMLRQVLKRGFGFENFREGQRWATQRVLGGKSAALVLPTGTGKSLCYQLPATILDGITLVVSPLLSLMQDQLHKLPCILPGGCLGTHQSVQQTALVIRALQKGEVKVLFVSPERLFSRSFAKLLCMNVSAPAGCSPSDSVTTLLDRIEFVCIDEAHCISQWSHNFRPSYLRISEGLKPFRANRVPILAITATATPRCLRAITKVLGTDPAEALEDPAVFVRPSVRANLKFSASCSKNKDKALVQLLTADSTPVCSGCCIVYVSTRRESETVAFYLRSNNVDAASYHAGLESETRGNILSRFMSDKLRVVVATVAFGMGLDKPNVRAVVHYSMPRSLESYVQETGRAGRDGLPSLCHTLLDEQDFRTLHSLAHSDGVERLQLRRLVDILFAGLPEQQKGATEPREAQVEIEHAEAYLDIKQAVLETILVLLTRPLAVCDDACEKDTETAALREQMIPYLEMRPFGYARCEAFFPAGLTTSRAKIDPLLQYMSVESETTQVQRRGTTVSASSFDTLAAQRELGLPSTSALFARLYDLKRNGYLSYKLTGLCARVNVLRGSICKAEKAAVVDALLQRCRMLESLQTRKLEHLYQALRGMANLNVIHALELFNDFAKANLGDNSFSEDEEGDAHFEAQDENSHLEAAAEATRTHPKSPQAQDGEDGELKPAKARAFLDLVRNYFVQSATQWQTQTSSADNTVELHSSADAHLPFADVSKHKHFLQADLKVLFEEISQQMHKSRAFPASIWCDSRFWGRFKEFRFEDLHAAADKLIANLRRKRKLLH